MDELDLEIIKSLAINSRTPYRQIADKTRLSVAGVHKRVQALIASGVIEGYALKVNPFFQEGCPVVVLGVMSGRKLKDVLAELRRDKETFQFMITGGNQVLIAGMLREPAGLEGYVDKVKGIAGIKDATVAFDSNSTKVKEIIKDMEVKELTPGDLRMLSVLKKDPRKPLSEVAEVLGTTPKMVSRRINKLTQAGWVLFSVQVNLQRSGDMIVAIRVNIDPGKGEQLEEALRAIPANVLIQRLHFSNIPDLMFLIIITKTQDQVRELVESLQDTEAVLDAVPNFVLHIENMPSWVDDIVPD